MSASEKNLVEILYESDGTTLKPQWLFCGISLLLSSMLGWIAANVSYINFPLGMNFWLIPSTIIAGTIVRKPFLFRVAPVLTFGLVLTVASSTSLPIAFSFVLTVVTLSLVAAVARLEQIVCSSAHQAATLQITYVPISRSFDLQNSPSNRHLMSLLFILGAWLLTAYWTFDFSWSVTDVRVFNQYREGLQLRFGLVPAGYLGIQLVFLLATLFAIAQGMLFFFKRSDGTTSMSQLLLRHELWKWNGWEQRKIAKALKKRN